MDNSKLNFNFSWHFVNNKTDKMFLENAKKIATLPDNIKCHVVFSIMYEHDNISKSIVMHRLIRSMKLQTELLLVGSRQGNEFVYDYSKIDYERYLSILNKDILKTI